MKYIILILYQFFLFNAISQVSLIYDNKSTNLVFEGNSFLSNYPLADMITLNCSSFYNSRYSFYKNNYATSASGIGKGSTPTNIMLNSTRKLNVIQNRFNGYRNVLIIFEGINDLYFYLNSGYNANQSCDSVFNNILTYAKQMADIGYKVVLNTLTPRNNAGTSTFYEIARQNPNNKLDSLTINGKLRRDFSIQTEYIRIFKSNLSKWNNIYLIDCGGDPNFGQIYQYRDSLYYLTDSVHPTTLMQNQLATYYLNACKLILK